MDHTHHTAEDVRATVRTLRKRARKVPADKRNGHWQIAKRRIADALTFAASNTDHAVQCCWEARHHLNHTDGS